MIIIHYVKDYHKRSERQAVLIPKYDSDPYFRVMFLGRVGLGLQPEPSRRQVQKTQAPLRVWGVAGNHAVPPLEPTDEASCHGVARLGRVGLGLQPEPSRRQVPKTQAPLRVLVVAGGHAAPWFEAAEAPCHGLARRVPFRVVGLGVQAPAPSWTLRLLARAYIPWRPEDRTHPLRTLRRFVRVVGRASAFPRAPCPAATRVW